MIRYRKVVDTDIDLIYNWTNDPEIRQISYNSAFIKYENHLKWFTTKLAEETTFFNLFSNDENEIIGFVRIEKKEEEFTIGLFIDKKHRGKDYSYEMLCQSVADFKTVYPSDSIQAYIKKDNIASIKSFSKAGFINPKELVIHDIPSIMLTKN
jgi:RimJ/RimL family protein N-acetyltransferase